jgi:hypothetical protein
MKNNKHLSRAVQLATLGLALGLASGYANAALQARYLDGSSTANAYYDTDLNITWLADANYGATANYGTTTTVDFPGTGFFTFDQANTWASSLSFSGTGASSGWRLPTAAPVGSAPNYNFSFNGSTDNGYNITASGNEMAHLFYTTLAIPAACSTSSTNVCDFQPGGVGSGASTDPFFNVQPYFYWTGTENANESNKAIAFNWADGYQDPEQTKPNYAYAFAVHNGDVGSLAPTAAVPEADTWAMLIAGLGLVGVMTRRRVSV